MTSPRKRRSTQDGPAILVRADAELLAAADAAARAEGLYAVEWWRRAARARLGLPEVQPRPERTTAGG